MTSPSSGSTSVAPEARTPGDRALKRLLWSFLHRLSAPSLTRRGPGAAPAAAHGADPGPPGPVQSTWRLFRRILGVEQPLQNRAEMLRQALIDLALTKEQQEVFEKVLDCNRRFYQIAIEGDLDGRPPWRRHVAFNMALLRVLHRHRCCQHVASRIAENSATEDEDGDSGLPLAEAEEALKYCHWTEALYEGCSPSNPEESSMSETTEAERIDAIMANVAKGCSTSSISRSTLRPLSADLDNDKQSTDPLCPRFILVMDTSNSELILCVRGTQTLSDLFADLIGDTEDFAGGQAHAGILHSSYRLLEKIKGPLQQGLEQLHSREKNPRLVLVGHSLGAGVCQLLAVLLSDGGGNWTLPKWVTMRCILFAPPPVFGLAPKARGWSKFDLGHFWRQKFDTGSFNRAFQHVREASVAFTMNFDIIPRTSLNNGYKLFQEARLLDDAVPWGKAEVLRRLALSDDASQVALAMELKSLASHAAKTRPAPSNPYAAQRAIAQRLFQLMLVPGGNSTFQPRRSDDSDEAAQGPPPADLSARALGGWLRKRSEKLKIWKERYAWIEDGELRFAPRADDADDAITVRIALTADSTSVSLLGTLGGAVTPCDLEFRDLTCSSRVGTSPASSGRRGSLGEKSLPTPYGFKIQTDAAWSGVVYSTDADLNSDDFPQIQSCAAAEVVVCAASAQERQEWLERIALELRQARERCLRICPAVCAEDFGHEALLAEGLGNEHNVNRYALALQAVIDQMRTKRGR